MLEECLPFSQLQLVGNTSLERQMCCPHLLHQVGADLFLLFFDFFGSLLLSRAGETVRQIVRVLRVKISADLRHCPRKWLKTTEIRGI